MGSSGAVEHHRRPGKEFNGISGIGRAMAVRIASLAAGACARLRSELRRSRLAF
jgi:hypothetical protein